MELDPTLCQFFDESLNVAISERKSITVEYQDGFDYFQSILTPTLNSKGAVETVIVVSRDITESKRREQKKNDFISLVGHELKTPVTSLRGLIQLSNKNLVTLLYGTDTDRRSSAKRMAVQRTIGLRNYFKLLCAIGFVDIDD